MEVTLKAGTILRSSRHSYRIEGVLGQGGFGITYKASERMVVNGVPVRVTYAIKEHFLNTTCDREEATGNVTCSNASRELFDRSRKDFIAEATRLRELGVDIDNIVKVSEVFEANSTAYYVMEYLEGESLKQYVNRTHPSEEAVIKLLMPVMRAVEKMHERKMTHLDIKPDNIMITTDDESTTRATLIDSGLSKHYNADGSPTSTINVMGSSDGYAPIEQYGGITTFSPTADVYALGATLFYCLTGRAPKKSTELAPGEMAREASAASARYGNAIAKAMAANKFDRYGSVGDFVKALTGGSGNDDFPTHVDLPSEETRPVEAPRMETGGKGKPITWREMDWRARFWGLFAGLIGGGLILFVLLLILRLI